ncbi:adenosylcobinamide-phosphate synthase CbiB [Hasllibacter sp. MH4015]|uniref:adenosylcobinamide-phosphate synthase CbiB n=1 Tax=Hasllibacter sp. MH4015 TaxID=2854029 RepID=UPI001CD47E14|nr:adenosylcobinamide-phosphate synthase CbiB [Hasllibacter sp. MH4015]
MSAAILAAAMALDALLGEPKWLWSRAPHPAVLMGRLVDWFDRRFNLGAARTLKGIAATAALSALAIALGLLIQALPLGWLWSLLLTAILLAQRSLADHVTAVADALRRSLPEGRKAVSMIVGRDPDQLDEPAIARAAIESAAENLSDGVVAPVFWFAVAGLPGILFCKIINTADSMIGHRTTRHAEFGWAAARLDDVLNYIPARLTALLIAITTKPSALKIAARDGPKHRSINAGWPEAAMAAALGLSLSGPRAYGGEMTDDPPMNATGTREATPGDIAAAVGVLWRVWVVLLIIVAAFTLV